MMLVVVAVGWWLTRGVVVEDGEDKDEGLREIFEVCVCVRICVHDYIILNYQHFLIAITMSLHTST